MANTRQHSFWACYFSVLRLVGLLEEDTLWSPEEKRTCYLWTFTFPDPGTRADASLAADKWSKLSRRLLMRKSVFLWVLEQGEIGRGWHYHAITRQYWALAWLRPLALLYGFGRINVKPIPVEKAIYVAKYIGKQIGSIESGVRRWGCVGFQGLLSRCIVFDRTVLTNTSGRAGLGEWVSLPPSAFMGLHVAERFSRKVGELPLYRNMKLKPHQLSVIERLFNEGHKVLVGEYRGTEAVIKKVNAYEAGKIVGKVSRIIVTHHVENLLGQGEDFRERLPDPSNREDGVIVTAEVKPACGKGDLCAVIVSNMSDKYGHDTGGIFNLSTVGDAKV